MLIARNLLDKIIVSARKLKPSIGRLSYLEERAKKRVLDHIPILTKASSSGFTRNTKELAELLRSTSPAFENQEGQLKNEMIDLLKDKTTICLCTESVIETLSLPNNKINNDDLELLKSLYEKIRLSIYYLRLHNLTELEETLEYMLEESEGGITKNSLLKITSSEIELTLLGKSLPSYIVAGNYLE